MVEYCTLKELTDRNRVPDGTDDCKKEDGTQVVEKEPVGHKVSRVKDDGREHVEEEGRWRERGNPGAVCVEEEEPDDDANHDKQTRFREDWRKFRCHVETCPRE